MCWLVLRTKLHCLRISNLNDTNENSAQMKTPQQMKHTMWISHNIKAFPNSVQFTLLTMLNVRCISFHFFFFWGKWSKQMQKGTTRELHGMFFKSRQLLAYICINTCIWLGCMNACDRKSLPITLLLEHASNFYILNDRFLAIAFPFSWKLKTFTWNHLNSEVKVCKIVCSVNM